MDYPKVRLGDGTLTYVKNQEEFPKLFKYSMEKFGKPAEYLDPPPFEQISREALKRVEVHNIPPSLNKHSGFGGKNFAPKLQGKKPSEPSFIQNPIAWLDRNPNKWIHDNVVQPTVSGLIEGWDKSPSLVRTPVEEWRRQRASLDQEHTLDALSGVAHPIDAIADLANEAVGSLTGTTYHLPKSALMSNPLAEQLGRLAPIFGKRGEEVYHDLTGRTYLSEYEINHIADPEERRRADRLQHTIPVNTVMDMRDLANGLVNAGVAGVKGLYHDIRDNTGSDIVREVSQDVARTVGGLAGGSLYSAASAAGDPMAQLQNSPLEFLGNAVIATGVGGALNAPTALGKASAVLKELSPVPLGARSPYARAASESLTPTRAARSLVTTATDAADNTMVAQIAQWVADPRAGVNPEALKIIDDYRADKIIAPNQAQMRAEQLLNQVPKADRATVRELLAGEPTRNVVPEWPDMVPDLQRNAKKLVENAVLTPGQAKALLANDPQGFDHLSSLVGGDRVAERIQSALDYSPIKVVNSATGENLGSMEYMVYGAADKIRPEDVRLEINPFAPPALRAKAEEYLPVLEGMRQLQVQVGGDLSRVNVGRGQSLLPLDVLRKHLAYYTHDAYLKEIPESLARGGPGTPGILPGVKTRFSKLKNAVGFEDRLRAGASDDLLASTQIGLAKATSDIERFRLLDNLAKLDDGRTVLTKAQALRLPEATRNRDYVHLTGDLPGNPADPIARYGALDDHWVAKPVANILRGSDRLLDTQNVIANLIERYGSFWKKIKVIHNLPSWTNAAVGNLQLNLVENGLRGGVNYTAQYPKILFRAVKLLRDDQWSTAAKTAGIIGERTGFEIGAIESVAKNIERVPLAEGVARWALSNLKRGLQSVDEQFQRGFSSIDTASKMALFEGYVKSQAELSGRSIPELLRDTDTLKAAREHIARSHFDYQDIPLGVSALDRYMLLPFSRYAWKSTGALINLPVRAPQLARSAVQIDREDYRDSTPRQQDGQDVQSSYTSGFMRPVSDELALNERNLTPFSLPDQVLGARERGDYSARQFDSTTNYQVGGPIVDIVNTINDSRDPQTGRRLADGWDKLGSVLKTAIAPGNFYQLQNKWIPAYRDVRDGAPSHPDNRGREMSPEMSVAHSLGIKLEPVQPEVLQRSYLQGYTQAKAELDRALEEALKRARTPEERADLGNQYQHDLGALGDKYQAKRTHKRR